MGTQPRSGSSPRHQCHHDHRAGQQREQMTVSARQLSRILITPLLLSFGFTFACYIAAGATLGLFFGAIAGATILTPPMALREQTPVARLLAAGAVVDGSAIV